MAAPGEGDGVGGTRRGKGTGRRQPSARAPPRSNGNVWKLIVVQVAQLRGKPERDRALSMGGFYGVCIKWSVCVF